MEENDTNVMNKSILLHASAWIPDRIAKWDVIRNYVFSYIDNLLPSNLPF